MAFCGNCGQEIPEGVKFCQNCGTAVETKNTAIYSSYTEEETSPEPAKKLWVDKIGRFWGLILLIVACMDYQSDPPAFTILLSGAIIAGAIWCLRRKYKWKFLTVLALILAIFCMIAGFSQGKMMGFFKTPTDKDYEAATESIVNVDKESEEVPEKKSDIVIEDHTDPSVESSAVKEAGNEKESVVMDDAGSTEESIQENPREEDSQTIDGVDPDLKAFLDSYEAFMDEYVTFMKKYMADPTNALSMLVDYARIMETYADFEEKIDEYDEKEMSAADAKYYLDVMTRCTLKLYEIY